MDAVNIAYYEANCINVALAARIQRAAFALKHETRENFVRYYQEGPVREFAGYSWDLVHGMV